jgi:uncharacterized membrane protein
MMHKRAVARETQKIKQGEEMLKRFGAKAIGIMAILLLSLYGLPSPAYAAGLGVSPPSLVISETLRGNEYSRTVTIFSSADEPVNVALTTEGTIAGWATFYDTSEENKPITELSIPAEGNAKAIVKIRIPDDAVNGEYESSLNVDTAPPANAPDSGMSVKLHSEILLSVSVTGNQRLAGKVTQMNANNTEVGLPVTLEIDFTNTGNVVARPEIKVKISQEGKDISEFSYTDTEVKVDSSEKIEVLWDASGAKSGEYLASVTVMLGETSLAQRDMVFRILPRGGLSSEGKLTGITSEGKAAPGAVSKILTSFSNTGAVETLVNGYAEIYLDGTLIKVLDSEQIVVNGGEEGTLTFYFTPEKEGTYEIKVHATMAGRQTNTVELTLNVGANAGSNEKPSNEEGSTGKPFNMLYPVIGGTGLVILIIVVIWAKRRAN